MTQPITNLTASWTVGTGIQLQWTPATDATNGSTYNIYVLENVLSHVPEWTLVGEGLPYIVSTATPGASVNPTLELASPLPSYFFPQQAISALLLPGSTVAPDSFAFQVIHIDEYEDSSIGVSISVFQNPQNTIVGAPHFPNVWKVDAFGQLLVTEQDSYSEVSNSVEMLVGTLPGQRPTVPTYGVPDLTFTRINDADLVRLIDIWEPRANPKVSVVYDDNEDATVSIQVQGVTP